MTRWDRYRKDKIKVIGILDIETHGFGFNANESYMICWGLRQFNLETKKSKTYYNILDKETLKFWNRKMKHDKRLEKIRPYDTQILPSLVKTMKECDLIVTQYGTYFDIPFIRSRCEILRIPFLNHTDKIKFVDTWRFARYGLKLKRNSLDNISRTLRINDTKTEFNLQKWVLDGVYGDKKELRVVLKHNLKDVNITDKVWRKLEHSFPIPTRYY